MHSGKSRPLDADDIGLVGEDLSELFGLDMGASPAAKTRRSAPHGGRGKARNEEKPKQENNGARQDGTFVSTRMGINLGSVSILRATGDSNAPEQRARRY